MVFSSCIYMYALPTVEYRESNIDIKHLCFTCQSPHSQFLHDDMSSNHLDFQIALCLVGKLLTKATFNAEALKNTLRNAWRPISGLIAKDLNTNLFAFQFFSETD